MLSEEYFKRALEEMIKQAGSQVALAQQRGLTQSQVSDYRRGRFRLENVTLGNLYKLFPNVRIDLVGIEPTHEVEPISQTMEEQLLTLYRSLSPEQKVQCFSIVVANFPEKVRKEMKK